MDNTIHTVVEALKPFANKLGQGAEALYRIYVKQQFAVGVAEILWGLFLIVIALVLGTKLAPWLHKRIREENEKKSYYSDTEAYWMGVMFTWAGVLTASVVAMSLVTNGAQHLVNPQYYAIKDLTCQVTNCNSR